MMAMGNNLFYLLPVAIITLGVWIDKGWKGVLAFWLIVAGLAMCVDSITIRLF